MPATARATPAAAPRVSHGLAALALTLLLGLQPVTTDIYLPALPALKHELGAAMAAAVVCARAMVRDLYAPLEGARVMSLGLSGLGVIGVHHEGAILLPQCRYAFGHGIHQPCGQAGAVAPFPQAAGTASALAGFALAGTAFVVGLWLGRMLEGGLLPCALTLALWSAMTAAVAWTLVQRIALEARPA